METINSGIFEYLSTIVPKENILKDEPMSEHTTFRVGGNASALIKISSPEELHKLITFFKREDIPYFVKGNGSNLLVGDKGFDGVILEMGPLMGEISVEGNILKAGAGALMSTIAKTALSHELGGFEFAAGIPGTIGGGVVMNAGAYDGELKDIVTSVEVMTSDGEILTVDNAGMQFGYRTSVIKKRPLTVISVTMKLDPSDKDTILGKMNELSEKRREKQPLEYPSAGSTFKRPEGYFAGKLIMDAGLRGFSIGGAAVSEKHCGFVINKGNATAADIYEVITEVRDRVKEKFGVTLEPEVIFLGSF
ncbi:MAG: UDP-N-acetylmuramate dehydrogenase [Lachnospiraceae bacterium]|nr:UDP-N-acetylmuramate dehydrogenase [Lachnospiraceae bacterium]